VRFSEPLLKTQFARLTADQPLERGDQRFVFLDQIRSARVIVQRAGLVLFDPDADQVTRKVATLGQPMKRLATQKLPGDLALVLNAVGSVSRHGLFSKSPTTWSIQLCLPVRHQGHTPVDLPKLTPDGLVCCAACFATKRVVGNADRGYAEA
jgi:hypothetical protein